MRCQASLIHHSQDVLLSHERRGGCTLRSLDMKHYTEWHLQMLIDVEPEKRTAAHTELLEIHQRAMKQIEVMGKMLEKQGKNLETYEMPAQFITQ